MPYLPWPVKERKERLCWLKTMGGSRESEVVVLAGAAGAGGLWKLQGEGMT